jgi:hypothetical protein
VDKLGKMKRAASRLEESGADGRATALSPARLRLRNQRNYAYEPEKFLGTTPGTTLDRNRRPAGQGKNAEALSAANTSGIQGDPE